MNSYRVGNGTQRLLMVSNRGPVEHKQNGDGSSKRVSGAGGLVSALGCAIDGMPVTWIAGAMSDGDRAAGAGHVELAPGRALHLVSPPAEAYKLAYETFSNGILWFLQHGLSDRLQRPGLAAEARHAWERGYVPVNQAFGRAVAAEMARTGARRAMLHDYHLYTAPRVIRSFQPDAALQQFIHIPWPAPDMWRHLPSEIVASICAGLLANDSVVFQTKANADHFLRTCAAYLPDVDIDGEDVERRGQHTRVWANPVSVHAPDLRARLAQPGALEYRAKLAGPAGMRTIVRVDRLDPAKNIVAGFRAYAQLLERHPEWRGKVRFLSFLVPSRTGVPQYQAYTDEVFAEVEAINGRYGDTSWQPVTVYHEHNRLQALVALTMYDVLLVNSLADGMNLVAKEGAVVNERDGALVLSTAAGAYDELRAGALPVQPTDVSQTAEALHAALMLSPVERRVRAQRLRDAVLRHGLRDWLQLLLDDLARIEGSSEEEALLAGSV